MEEKGEGLKITAKGSKDLPGGRRLHVIVAIAHGKGDVLSEAYDKMNGVLSVEVFVKIVDFVFVYGCKGIVNVT